jgi:protein-S-isoprenylcysteine O-methyltransferase Ste14
VIRAWLAIGLEAVFFGLAFGWRSWVQWRRTGSTGFIRPRRGAGAAELAGSGGFVVALVLLVAAPVADLAGLPRVALLDTTWAVIAGVIVGVCGIGLTLVSQLAMGESWRIGVDASDRTELVTGGVFGSVRNPIFTAMVVATVGLVFLVPNLVSVAALVVLVAALEVQVRLVEEPYLRVVHGDVYDSYAATVGRFVPHVGLAPVPR